MDKATVTTIDINVTIGVSCNSSGAFVEPSLTAISPNAVNATDIMLTVATMHKWSSGE